VKGPAKWKSKATFSGVTTRVVVSRVLVPKVLELGGGRD